MLRKRRYKAYLEPGSSTEMPGRTERRRRHNHRINDNGVPRAEVNENSLPREGDKENETDILFTLESVIDNDHQYGASSVSDNSATSMSSYGYSISSEESQSPFEYSDLDSDLESASDSPLHPEEEMEEEAEEEPREPFVNMDFEADAGNGFKVFEVLLMALSFSLRHSLSFVGLQDLLKLLGILLCNEAFPTTKYLLKRLFDAKENLTIHYACKFCKGLLFSDSDFNFDHSNERNRDIFCHHCNAINSSKTCSVFISMPIEPQLRNILGNEQIADYLLQRTTFHDGGPLKDISDGTVYRKLFKERNLKPQDMTITFNTDGINVFKSNFSSIWPILMVVNELPAKLRNFEILIAAVWFGKGAPCMRTLFKPVVEEFHKLAEEGFKWVNQGQVIVSRVFGVCCAADSKARCQVNNMCQFNAKYGCPWCYHPGTLVRTERNPNGCIKYSMIHGSYKDREDEELRRDMLKASQMQKNFLGVKGVSILISLPSFDVCEGFVVDYMHCVLIGVTKALSNLWFEKSNLQYYIGNPKTLKILDNTILEFKTNRSMQRRPRKITDRCHWKASEWKNFLLYYSLPLLTGLLPEIYFQHLILLVSSVHTLLLDSITEEDLDLAEKNLLQFVIQFEDLYGEENMTFNVHQLCHLVKSVKCFGPLWAHSCFPFESFNSILLNQIHGSRGIVQQIVHRFKLRDAVSRICAKRSGTMNPRALHYIEALQEYLSPKPLGFSTIDGFSHLSKEKVSIEKEQYYRSLFPNMDSCSGKGIIYGHLVVGNDSKSSALRNDSFFKLDEKHAIEVSCISSFKNEQCAILIGRKWSMESAFCNCRHVYKLIEKDTTLCATHVNDKMKKLILLEYKDMFYVASKPNDIEIE